MRCFPLLTSIAIATAALSACSGPDLDNFQLRRNLTKVEGEMLLPPTYKSVEEPSLENNHRRTYRFETDTADIYVGRKDSAEPIMINMFIHGHLITIYGGQCMTVQTGNCQSLIKEEWQELADHIAAFANSNGAKL